MRAATKRAGIIPRNQIEIQCIELITLAHRYLNDMLNVDTQLLIERKADWGMDTNYAGYICGYGNLVVVNFRKIRGHPLLTALIVLGHEMRHAVQFHNGWLTVKSKSRFVNMVHGQRIESDIWKGKFYKEVRYESAPWEVDANLHQVEIAQAVIDAGVITSDQSQIILPGNRLHEILESRTKREVGAANEGRNISWFQAYSESEKEHSERRKTDFAFMLEKMTAVGIVWTGEGFVVKDMLMNNLFNKINTEYKKGSRRRINRDGACWMALDQLSKNFPSWSKSAVEHAFKNHMDLMESQYVPWKTRELDLNDFVC